MLGGGIQMLPDSLEVEGFLHLGGGVSEQNGLGMARRPRRQRWEVGEPKLCLGACRRGAGSQALIAIAPGHQMSGGGEARRRMVRFWEVQCDIF